MIGRVSGSQLASTVPVDLDLLVGLDGQHRAVRHLVALALAAMLVDDDDLAGTRDDHQLRLVALVTGNASSGLKPIRPDFAPTLDATAAR